MRRKNKASTAKKLLSLLLVLALALAPAAAQAAEEAATGADAPVFGDLPETDGLYPFARYLQCRGIMEGLPDGTFRPAEAMTRAEAAKAAVLAKGLPLTVPGGPAFPDVSAEYWACPYIETAAGAGLFTGYPGGAFGPGEPITRGEAAALLLRLSGGAPSDAALSMADVAAGHWAYGPAVTAVEAGLMALSSEGLFVPEAPLSRGEFAQSLCVLLALGPDLRAAGLTGRLTVFEGRATLVGKDGNARSVTA